MYKRWMDTQHHDISSHQPSIQVIERQKILPYSCRGVIVELVNVPDSKYMILNMGNICSKFTTLVQVTH